MTLTDADFATLEESGRTAAAQSIQRRLEADGLRYCAACSAVKPLEQFYRNARRIAGRTQYCIPCTDGGCKRSDRVPEGFVPVHIEDERDVPLLAGFEDFEDFADDA